MFYSHTHSFLLSNCDRVIEDELIAEKTFFQRCSTSSYLALLLDKIYRNGRDCRNKIFKHYYGHVSPENYSIFYFVECIILHPIS